VNLLRGLKAVHLGHGYVEDDEVWLEFRSFLNRVHPIHRFTTHLPAWMTSQQSSEQLSEVVIIVGNQNPSGRNLSSNPSLRCLCRALSPTLPP
jgi:hypothetical protein